jgi:hypothetical protein
MKSKEEVIKKAYGEHWGTVENYVNSDGWCSQFLEYLGINVFGDEAEYTTINWRPKSLQGIEDNNGWIKVKNERELPSDLEVCHFIPCGSFEEQFTGFIKDDEVYFVDSNLRVNKDDEQDLIYLNSWLKCQITHYQPIQKPNSPLH